MADNVKKAVDQSELSAEFLVVDEEETSESDKKEIDVDDEGIKDDNGAKVKESNDSDVIEKEVHEIEDKEENEDEEVNQIEDTEVNEIETEDHAEVKIGAKPNTAKKVEAQIKERVTLALKSKLTGLQMQQMMAFLENVTDETGIEEERIDEDDQEVMEIVTIEDDDDDVEDVTPSSPEPRLSVLKLPNQEPVDILDNVDLARAKVTEWEGVINKVCSILDIDAVPVDASPHVPDSDSADDSKWKINKASVSLPADGFLLDCLKKGKESKKRLTVSKLEKRIYLWPQSDDDSLGYFAEPEQELLKYMPKLMFNKYGQAVPCISKTGVNEIWPLPTIQNEIRMGDTTMIYQQKAISYASYFLAALGAGIRGEQEVDKQSLYEIMQMLQKCLMDICEMSFRASLRILLIERRLYLDRMKLTNSRAFKDLMILPSSPKMFGDQLKPILRKHNLPLNPNIQTGPGFGLGKRGKINARKARLRNRRVSVWRKKRGMGARKSQGDNVKRQGGDRLKQRESRPKQGESELEQGGSAQKQRGDRRQSGSISPRGGRYPIQVQSGPSREGRGSPSWEGLRNPSKEGQGSRSREGEASRSREGRGSRSREGPGSRSREGPGSRSREGPGSRLRQVGGSTRQGGGSIRAAGGSTRAGGGSTRQVGGRTRQDGGGSSRQSGGGPSRRGGVGPSRQGGGQREGGQRRDGGGSRPGRSKRDSLDLSAGRTVRGETARSGGSSSRSKRRREIPDGDNMSSNAKRQSRLDQTRQSLPNDASAEQNLGYISALSAERNRLISKLGGFSSYQKKDFGLDFGLNRDYTIFSQLGRSMGGGGFTGDADLGHMSFNDSGPSLFSGSPGYNDSHM